MIAYPENDYAVYNDGNTSKMVDYVKYEIVNNDAKSMVTTPVAFHISSLVISRLV
jgi:hypothetical protein